MRPHHYKITFNFAKASKYGCFGTTQSHSETCVPVPPDRVDELLTAAALFIQCRAQEINREIESSGGGELLTESDRKFLKDVGIGGLE